MRSSASTAGRRHRARSTALTLTLALFLASGLGGALAEDQAKQPQPGETPEQGYRDTPPGPPALFRATDDPAARQPAGNILRGPYLSIQINTDFAGQDIVGDAANETTLAVDPTNPDHLVVGWRQFDSIGSNFRQAGYSVSFDGGSTWSPVASLQPFLFRSDPVVAFDGSGVAYHQALTIENGLANELRSSNDGAIWSVPTPMFGGDKNWMTVDTSGGTGDGNIYGTWRALFSCCDTNIVTRSTDGGMTFDDPGRVPLSPGVGTMAVAPDGALLIAGVSEADGTFCSDCFVVARSADLQDSGVTEPSWTSSSIEMDGSIGLGIGGSPNPAGLLGQVNVAVSSAPGPAHGDVYVLASVAGGGLSGSDPLDVRFVRSVDDGATWSAPLQVHQDPTGQGTWHWFGTMSVAPSGRIDVVWNDTRASGLANVSELYYAYSVDRGQTWSPGVPASPAFDSHLGWPQQAKLGDYYGISSDDAGADLAYAATFRGGQDVYYVRLFPDCNGNGRSDVADIDSQFSEDCNDNRIPDDCEEVGECLPVGAVPALATDDTSPLRLAKRPDGSIGLTWDPSCSATDADFAVYEGELGEFTSHEASLCTTGGFTSIVHTPGDGDRYFLIVAHNGALEGAYGINTDGERIGARGATCLPRGTAATCSEDHSIPESSRRIGAR